MTLFITCDYCGADIEPREVVTLSLGTEDRHAALEDEIAFMGHYHRHDCFDRLWESFQLIHEWGRALADAETLTGQDVTERRRRLKLPGDDGEV
jgi:hypothetical protein